MQDQLRDWFPTIFNRAQCKKNDFPASSERRCK